MQHRIVGLFAYPWDPTFTVHRGPFRHPGYLYRWALWYKANPRDQETMRAYFAEAFPHGEFVEVDAAGAWKAVVAGADTVVLLYPDALGLGFRALEREVWSLKKTWASVRVLNGRRRFFLLDGPSRRALALRRAAEWSMVGEWFALAGFVVVTPLMLAWDWIRGRT